MQTKISLVFNFIFVTKEHNSFFPLPELFLDLSFPGAWTTFLSCCCFADHLVTAQLIQGLLIEMRKKVGRVSPRFCYLHKTANLCRWQWHPWFILGSGLRSPLGKIFLLQRLMHARVSPNYPIQHKSVRKGGMCLYYESGWLAGEA